VSSYRLRLATPARETLDLLDSSPQYAAKLRKVRPGAPKAKVWDAYVENRTPGARRIWWMYGPDEIRDDQAIAVITVLDIGPHP